MGRKKNKEESIIENSDHEVSNDLQSKIENKSESDVKGNNPVDSTALNLNIDLDTKEKTYNKDDVTRLAAEASGSSSRPKRKCKPVSFRPPRTPSPESPPTTPRKKMKLKKNNLGAKNIGVVEEIDDISLDSHATNQSFEDSSSDENDESDEKIIFPSAAIAMDKLNINVEIDPNVVDRYTDSGFTAGGSTPESPETRRQRIDCIARQCRLHPANKKYNQGPVENPPLITPGKLVGYTPGGQRHEVDLNFDRPTWFNSEYARMQWDYATRINVTRMFHELETGTFLPDGLDPNIERKYFAEREMASKLATEHFEDLAKASSGHISSSHGQTSAPNLTQEEKEHMQLLEIENELIELNKYAVVRFEDFAREIDYKLRKALDLTLTPLMIKKNPLILDTLEAFSSQCMSIEVVLAARAMLEKIKALFQVPEDKEFREFIAEEVEKLKEKTKSMSGFDIMMMTEEPSDEPDGDSSEPLSLPPRPGPDELKWSDVELSDDEESVPESVVNFDEREEDTNEVEDEWIPIENGDNWVDISSYENYANNDHSYVNLNGVNEDEDEYENIGGSSDDDDEDAWTTHYESDDSSTDESMLDDLEAHLVDNLLGTLVSEE